MTIIKVISKVFLFFSIFMPFFFFIIMIISHRKFKRNKRYRRKLIHITVDSFMVNFCIYSIFTIFVLNKVCIFNHSSNLKTNETSNLTKKGFKIVKKGGATYIDGTLIVNKTYSISKKYYPINTHAKCTSETSFCTECLVNEVYDKYQEMISAAAKNGLNIWIQSGYRSYDYQVKLYNDYVRTDGKEAADKFSSRPGYSEHQTGLAFDLNSVSDDFINTDEGKWINDNCYKYGFIIRFPKNKEKYTGYKYESWHLRYVGTDLATKLYNGGDWISLEEYYGITSKYK